MRLKIEIGKHLNNYAYMDITITTKENDNFDNEKIMEYIKKIINSETSCDVDIVNEGVKEIDKGNVIYCDSIVFDYDRGLMAEKYTDIRKAFKIAKEKIKKIEGGKRLRE